MKSAKRIRVYFAKEGHFNQRRRLPAHSAIDKIPQMICCEEGKGHGDAVRPSRNELHQGIQGSVTYQD